MKVNQQFGEFVKTYRSAIDDQRLDKSEIKELKKQIKAISTPHLKQRAEQIFNSAQLKAKTGGSLPKLSLFPIEDNMLEADLQLNLSNDSGPLALIPEGTIRVQRNYLEQTLIDALWSSERIRDIELNYDSENHHYTLKGNYRLDYLPDPSFSLTLEPQSQGGKLQFLIHDLEYSGPELGFVSDWLLKKLATSLSDLGINSNYDQSNQSVQLDSLSLDLNDLIRFGSGLSSKVSIDFEEVNMEVNLDSQGNVIFDLYQDELKSNNRTSHSDLDLILEPGALKSLVNQSLQTSDFQVKQVTIGENNQLKFSCEAHLKEVTEGLSTALLILSGGRASSSGKSKINFDVEGTLEGRKLWLTPQLNRRLTSLAGHKMRDSVIIKYDDSLNKFYVDMGQLLPEEVGLLESIEITNQQIILKSQISASKLLGT